MRTISKTVLRAQCDPDGEVGGGGDDSSGGAGIDPDDSEDDDEDSEDMARRRPDQSTCLLQTAAGLMGSRALAVVPVSIPAGTMGVVPA